VLFELYTLNKLFSGEGLIVIFKSILEKPIPNIEESEPLFQPILKKFYKLFYLINFY
jgi:hypothetical protein